MLTLHDAARLPLKAIPKQAIVPILSGPNRGQRWIVGSHTHGCWLGSYERPTQAVLRALVRPGDTVIDAGANVGFFTLLAARLVGPTGRVIAFEPFDTNLEMLRRHLEINRLETVRVEPFALGKETAPGALFWGNAANASMYPHTAGHPSIAISVVALDEWRANGTLPHVDAIKMDIEGAEGAAILGMRRVLAEDRPAIFMALHGGPFEEEMISLFHALDYHVTTPNGQMVRTAGELIALPRDSALCPPKPFGKISAQD